MSPSTASSAMSEQVDSHLLVNQLQGKSLALDDQASESEVAGILSRLAVSLRKSEIREALSSSSLSNHLSKLLGQASGRVEASLTVIEQTGRVAANLAADSDAGRDSLIAAGYIINCCRILDECCDVIDKSLYSIKALTVSLLNLVIEGHERSVDELSHLTTPLVKLSDMILGRPKEEDDGVQILKWIWTILGIVLEDHPDPTLLPHLALPFTIYSDAQADPPPIPVLSSAAELFDAWCNAEEIHVAAFSAQVAPIAHFVETAIWSGDDEHEEGSDSKAFAGLKGSLINGLVGLSSSLPAMEEEFWSRIEEWLSHDDRDDLQSCAMLSYGNRAREDSSAIDILPVVLPSIRRILQPGITAQVLHGVIGLLRNLSIPEANKVTLGETDLLDKLVESEVWSKDKDMLGSVQGGAVGIVKNLCRGNPSNSGSVALHPAVLDQILNLLKRTDDPAIRFEATRVFVNCIRSISANTTERNALARFEDKEIISALLDMFRQSGPYPVLANEAIIALALLATFGTSDTALAIQTGVADLMERVTDTLAPTEGKESASREVRANLVTLLRQLDNRGGVHVGIGASVKAVLESAAETGRGISEEGRSL